MKKKCPSLLCQSSKINLVRGECGKKWFMGVFRLAFLQWISGFNKNISCKSSNVESLWYLHAEWQAIIKLRERKKKKILIHLSNHCVGINRQNSYTPLKKKNQKLGRKGEERTPQMILGIAKSRLYISERGVFLSLKK